MAKSKIEEEYFMHSDKELGRLASNHAIFKDAMGGLVLAPVDFSKGPLQVLDSCTADGHWIRDLAASLPSNARVTFVGTDLNEVYFPAAPPEGTSYHVQDINKSWPSEWKGRFDLVHQRLALVGAGQAGGEAVKSIATLVKPGGYIQLVESELTGDERNGPAKCDFFTLLQTMCGMAGVDPTTFGRSVRKYVEDAGFVDVHEKKVDCLMGSNNPDPQLAKLGVYATELGIEGLVRAVKSFPTVPPSLQNVNLDTLAARVTAELEEQGGWFPMRVVWGRKPEESQ